MHAMPKSKKCAKIAVSLAYRAHSANTSTTCAKTQEAATPNAMNREEDKLRYQIEALEEEIARYENNLGFFSMGNKNAKNPLMKDVEEKIKKLKSDQRPTHPPQSAGYSRPLARSRNRGRSPRRDRARHRGRNQYRC